MLRPRFARLFIEILPGIESLEIFTCTLHERISPKFTTRSFPAYPQKYKTIRHEHITDVSVTKHGVTVLCTFDAVLRTPG